VRILENIERLQFGLQGDIKRLTDFTPEYRLRVGNYRILFERREKNNNLSNSSQKRRLQIIFEVIVMAPIILEKNGKKEFVILSYEEYLKLKEIAEDYEDLKALREAKEEEKKKINLDIYWKK